MARLALRSDTHDLAVRKYSLASDAEVIADCLAGNEQAWDALIDRYQRLIYSVPLRLGLSETDAQDVFQTVCLLLLNHLEDLRDTNRLAGWLALTTRRESWRLQNRNSAVPNLTSQIGEAEWQMELAAPVGGGSAPLTPEEFCAVTVDQFLVRQGLDQLIDRCRRLLELLYCADPPTTYADDANVLGIPLGSIGPQRARCLERLEKILVGYGF